MVIMRILWDSIGLGMGVGGGWVGGGDGRWGEEGFVRVVVGWVLFVHG